jgi:drug/metabolite transporter (DMT)-like permease
MTRPVSARSAASVGMIALAGGIIGISFSPIFVTLSEIGPTATAVYRMVLALPVLALWMGLERRTEPEPRRLTRRDWLILALSGLMFTGDLVAWHTSIRTTGVANATFLGNLAPLVVTLGAWLLFHERITLGFVLGLAIALGGAGLLMGASAFTGSGDLLGDALGVVTALFYGAYLLTIKQLRGGLPTGQVMLISSAFSCVGLLAASVVLGEGLLPATLYGWGMLVGIALVSQAGGQSLIALAMRHLPASLASAIMLTNPVISALLAWVILGQSLKPLQGLGCAVVLGGIALAQRLGRAAR